MLRSKASPDHRGNCKLTVQALVFSLISGQPSPRAAENRLGCAVALVLERVNGIVSSVAVT